MALGKKARLRKPLEAQFVMARDPPAAWGWDEYEAWLEVAWPALLMTANPLDEKPFQQFLERHPCLIPGGEGTGESFGGHHGGWNDMVISQPSLPGISKKIPDFMWLTMNSADIIPVIVEIEAPGKRWFNKSGQRSSKLTQAQDQLAEWGRQLDNAANRQLLSELYDFPRRWTLSHNLVPRLLLIYGRSEELKQRPELNQMRRHIKGPATEAMTFDRLRPIAGSRNAVCVRMEKGSPAVLAIPPTFRLGPANAEAIATVAGWEQAISANQEISSRRKRFLLSRLPYWAELGRQTRDGANPGPHSAKDWE